ncbi:hypothetical protein [Campylobacter majalis]|uniref:hypothetical protein n=1 Tax=Campylobacter majalis TaxID=2790656 RepID=UPI003D690F54
MTKFYNSTFPIDLNNYLNFVLKNDFFGKNELVIQLNETKISHIETDLGWKLFVFDLDKKNVPILPIEFNKKIDTILVDLGIKDSVYLLFAKHGYILECEFCNLSLENNFETEFNKADYIKNYMDIKGKKNYKI